MKIKILNIYLKTSDWSKNVFFCSCLQVTFFIASKEQEILICIIIIYTGCCLQINIYVSSIKCFKYTFKNILTVRVLNKHIYSSQFDSQSLFRILLIHNPCIIPILVSSVVAWCGWKKMTHYIAYYKNVLILKNHQYDIPFSPVYLGLAESM